VPGASSPHRLCTRRQPSSPELDRREGPAPAPRRSGRAKPPPRPRRWSPETAGTPQPVRSCRSPTGCRCTCRRRSAERTVRPGRRPSDAPPRSGRRHRAGGKIRDREFDVKRGHRPATILPLRRARLDMPPRFEADRAVTGSAADSCVSRKAAPQVARSIPCPCRSRRLGRPSGDRSLVVRSGRLGFGFGDARSRSGSDRQVELHVRAAEVGGHDAARAEPGRGETVGSRLARSVASRQRRVTVSVSPTWRRARRASPVARGDPASVG
jgi:hypothetical protein